MSKIKLLLALALVAIIATTVAGHAVVIDTDGSGKVTGAQDVDVNGAFYDVQFEDGTCVSVFNGCTSTADFPFHNLTDALAAAQALLDQVLPNTFPFHASGCTFSFECFSFIPYDVTSPNMDFSFVDNSTFIVGFFPPPNFGSGNGIPTDFDTTIPGGADDKNFAVFTPSPVSTPEPGTVTLLGVGLAGLMVRWRKRNQQKYISLSGI
jgi:hypothetical protein